MVHLKIEVLDPVTGASTSAVKTERERQLEKDFGQLTDEMITLRSGEAGIAHECVL